MNTLFDYIEKELINNDTVDLHSWGDDERTRNYDKMKMIYDSKSPVMVYNDVNYLIIHHGATNGSGGMDQGSPDSFLIRKVGVIKKVLVDRPRPVENPDFSNLINRFEEKMDEIIAGTYNVDSDENYFYWQESIKALYGNNIFDWWDKNTKS